jgi:hypothetical protein
MRRILTTNDESSAKSMARPRKHQFTLMDLLTFVTAIPVCIGVIAAVECTAFDQSVEWFGTGWYGVVRRFLIDNVGLPSNFVTGYVSFAMIDFPAWICYAMIASILGLIRSKWSLTIGVAFILSIFVWDLIFDSFSGLHGYINLRLVSLFGVVVAALCFAITRRIRGGSHAPDRTTGQLAKGLICLAILATLAVSIYGWWLVAVVREASSEHQEMLSNSNPQ